MKVSQINQTNFRAGRIFFKNFDTNKIKSCDAIKKIAEDKNIDIYILKRNDNYYHPTHDLYTVVGNMPGAKHSVNCELVNHTANQEELSVRIYNAALKVMEFIEKNLV